MAKGSGKKVPWLLKALYKIMIILYKNVRIFVFIHSHTSFKRIHSIVMINNKEKIMNRDRTFFEYVIEKGFLGINEWKRVD